MLNRVIEEGAYADMLLADVNPLDQRPKAGNLAKSVAALVHDTHALNLIRDGLDIDLRCFHSCHSRCRVSARNLSITLGRFLRRWSGYVGKVMPRSNRKPRISLISAVRLCTSRSTTRCMACTSSCSCVLIGTKRMFCLGHRFRESKVTIVKPFAE